jgi:hypothetical protein
MVTKKTSDKIFSKSGNFSALFSQKILHMGRCTGIVFCQVAKHSVSRRRKKQTKQAASNSDLQHGIDSSW